MNEIETMLYVELKNGLAFFKREIDIKFQRTLSKAVFSVKFDTDNIQVHVNSNAIYGTVVKATGVNFYYCVYFVLEYLRVVEQVAEKVPSSYFDGMVLLNCCADIDCKDKVVVYSPIKEKGIFDKNYRVRALEVDCAIRALARTLITLGDKISQSERADIKRINDGLMLYTELPELSYTGRKYPVFSLFDLLDKAGKNAGRDYAVISGFSTDLTFDELVKLCEDTRNPFFLGAAVRLAIFCNLKVDSDNTQIMEEVYRIRSLGVPYLKQCGDFRLTKQNAAFVEKTMKVLNHFLASYSFRCESGVLHCLE
ncbi:MAG: hypothetical protein ACI4JS_07800, partial [Oscillospiraceae bacterium]